MDEFNNNIGDAQRRLFALIEITRWIWVVNGAVMIVGMVFSRYEIAGLAGFTGVLALAAAAVAKRVVSYLGPIRRTIHTP